MPFAARDQELRAEHRYDVIVVGAGQAGLATGAQLARSGLSFLVLEGRARPGDSWRDRHDSLRLFSPRRYSSLPGLKLDGDQDGYPGKDEVADYLAGYAKQFAIPVACNTRVVALRRRATRFEVEIGDSRILQADVVILATGPFQRSVVPQFARDVAPEVVQLTAQTYRRPDQLPRGRILVVGGGGTGRQIASELALQREVWLSVGRSPVVTPARIAGKDVQWWFDHLGALNADRDGLVGRLVRRNDAFPGVELRNGALRRRGIRLMTRTCGADAQRVYFADGSTAAFSAIVWAVGYEDDTGWVRIPGVVDAAGRFVEERGVSPVRGLYFVGRSWQTCRASALLCGVGHDAAMTVAQVRRFVAETAHHPAGARSVPAETGKPAVPPPVAGW